MKNNKTCASSFDIPNLRFVIDIKNNEKEQLLEFIGNFHRNDSGIVYCITKKRVELFTKYLKEAGFNAYPYHSGLGAEIQEKNKNIFIKQQNAIIVTTTLLKLGQNKPDIRFVAHVDLPKSIESYYHQIKCAGRDGQKADAWMIYGFGDIIRLKKFIRDSENSEIHKKISLKNMNEILAFAETIDCRRKTLLKCLGEENSAPCNNCDNCLEPPEAYDATECAQKALSCIYRVEKTSFAFGMSHIISILRGSENEKIKKFGHDKLSTFGIGKDVEIFRWESIIRQLAIQKIVNFTPQKLTLRLTKKSYPILRGESRFFLRKNILKTNENKKFNQFSEANFSTQEEISLFKKLKELRAALAKAENVPSHIIFHDKTLFEMTVLKPKNIENMGKISGIGKIKLEKFGKAFLKVINN